ncbi:MAG: hypothetical protein BWZ08_02709 [candidate division BRC1 bacterium ADurb.BinA292]|nr:MAG: hypothetical protein BWZ08_02709 [candidate division BRC1 bacterium ADurb.BinA292]
MRLVPRVIRPDLHRRLLAPNPLRLGSARHPLQRLLIVEAHQVLVLLLKRLIFLAFLGDHVQAAPHAHPLQVRVTLGDIIRFAFAFALLAALARLLQLALAPASAPAAPPAPPAPCFAVPLVIIPLPLLLAPLFAFLLALLLAAFLPPFLAAARLAPDVLADVEQRFERQLIAPLAQPRDLAQAGARRDRPAAELLAGVDVGDMHFDHRQADPRDRVAQRHRRVAVTPRVDDHAVAAVARPVQRVDQLPFLIALVKFHVDRQTARLPAQPVLQILQRLMTVDFGLAVAEQVQIRAVQHENAHDARFAFQRRIVAGTRAPAGRRRARRGVSRPAAAQGFGSILGNPAAKIIQQMPPTHSSLVSRPSAWVLTPKGSPAESVPRPRPRDGSRDG